MRWRRFTMIPALAVHSLVAQLVDYLAHREAR